MFKRLEFSNKSNFFGAEAGFLTGAISALASNMFFGQGPWTPFQVFTWGIIGFLAGVLAKNGLLNNKIVLSIYGAFAGVLFTLVLEVWSVLTIYNAFNFTRYIALLYLSLPFTTIYIVSNVMFYYC